MLHWILKTSLANRVLVLTAAVLALVLGTGQALKMPIDVLPDLDRPVVTIMTDAHGLAPESVEQLVTWPIEQAVSGATGVLRVRSRSTAGLSIVQVDFDWDADVLDVRQIVSEKLRLAEEKLPEGAHPMLAPIASIMGQVQLVGFRTDGETTDALELRQIIERDVRPRLAALPGMAQIITLGGEPTELQIEVDEVRLRAFGVTLAEVAIAVQRANVSAAGSPIEIGPKGPLVAVEGRAFDAADVAAAVVRDDATRPIRIRDVATVELGAAKVRVGSAGIDGRDGVILVITKQPGTDTLELARRVDDELESIRAGLPTDVHVDASLFRQAEFIERAIDNVLLAVRDGAILVVVILFAFLANIRTTAITLLAIPLSVALSALVFAAFGLTINTMTLGGLAVAIGTLVDDAIVDVENVYRRLRQNAIAHEPAPLLDVVLLASSEIRRPVLYGTLLVTVVWLPLFFLSGIEGRLLAPVGLAFLVSVGASLLVAMTVTPVVCSYLLGGKFAEREGYGSSLARMLQDSVERVVATSIAHTPKIIASGAALTLCAVALLATRGSTFLPPFQEGAAQVNIFLPPDVSLATSDAFGRRLEQAVAGVEGVRSVARRTGRAPDDEHVMPLNVTEAVLAFDPETTRSRDEILDDVRAHIAEAVPGVNNSTEQPLAHLLSHLLSGVNAQVALKITGPDLAYLRRVAKRVEGVIRPIPGVVDLFTEPQVLVDHCEVRPRRDDLARFGIDVAALAHTVELALGGEQVSRLARGRVTWPIVVRLEDAAHADPTRLAEIRLRSATGRAVRLGDVADVVITKTPNELARENTERRVVVQHNVSGRALGDVVADVERALEPIRAEFADRSGYALRISGTFEAQQEASRTIGLLTIVSIFAMIAILHRHFGSLRLSLLILLTRPIAFLGAVAAVVLTGQDVSIATLVGLIALLGIAVRNAILYIDHAMALSNGSVLTPAILGKAARDRVVPVLMTALTSGIGVLPLALSGDEPGREILYPVATVILGGLVTNTLLDFLVTPGLLANKKP